MQTYVSIYHRYKIESAIQLFKHLQIMSAMIPFWPHTSAPLELDFGSNLAIRAQCSLHTAFLTIVVENDILHLAPFDILWG